MQAYFDRHDAELELETFVTKSHPKADSCDGDQAHSLSRRRVIDIVGLSIVLGAAVVLMVAHIGAAVPAKLVPVPKKQLTETRFVIEIPPVEKLVQKPKPKPKIEPPKPKKTKRLRSIPDSRLDDIKPINEPEKREPSKEDMKRDVSKESAEKRAMPAVKTPVIAEPLEVAQRDQSAEVLRYAYVSDAADTIGGFVNVVSGSDKRSFSEGESMLSRVKLDPYHYTMVTLCLRLCVKSMFTHSGMSRTERESSSGWLEVERGGYEQFSYLHGGNWIRFDVRSDLIGDISNVDFVEIPYDMADEEVNLLLEEVTRSLCGLLGYDDCFEQL